MGKGEDELGVENLPHACYRLLKNRGLSLSVHFYMILPATLFVRCHVSNGAGVTMLATSEYGAEPERNQYKEGQEAVHHLRCKGE